jgi:predicted nucleotidyltransferase
MDLSRPLSVVTPTVDADVLAALAHADKGFTPGELHRVIQAHSISGLRKSLLRLVEQGIVTSQAVGSARVYTFNRRHLAASAIIELAGLRERFLQHLRERIATWPFPPVYAALFGSAARGQMRPGSDIDLFVVRPEGIRRGEPAAARPRAETERVWDEAILALETEAAALTGNDVRILEMGEDEVSEGLQAEAKVLGDIQRDGIRLIGDRSDRGDFAICEFLGPLPNLTLFFGQVKVHLNLPPVTQCITTYTAPHYTRRDSRGNRITRNSYRSA